MPRALIISLLAVALVGCGRSKRTEVALTGATFTNELQMQLGDSCLFRLPSGDTVAVWCERPRSFFGTAEQTDSKSGLRTVWGEAPLKKPKEILVKVGTNNHYAVVGWKSYIAPSFVRVVGDATREYELKASDYRFWITEDLRATNCLPVIIRVKQE